VNTGWSGGAYGVGQRIKLVHTRTIIDAIHNGTLAKVRTQPDPVFGFELVPECLGVPSEILVPRNSWADKAAYDAAAKKLFQLFQDNFKNYEGDVRATVADAAA
jgi:phosphoenolpyruvate carboxykinase (ATP)